jgi:hypothetical protein
LHIIAIYLEALFEKPRRYWLNIEKSIYVIKYIDF